MPIYNLNEDDGQVFASRPDKTNIFLNSETEANMTPRKDRERERNRGAAPPGIWDQVHQDLGFGQ